MIGSYWISRLSQTIEFSFDYTRSLVPLLSWRPNVAGMKKSFDEYSMDAENDRRRRNLARRKTHKRRVLSFIYKEFGSCIGSTELNTRTKFLVYISDNKRLPSCQIPLRPIIVSMHRIYSSKFFSFWHAIGRVQLNRRVLRDHWLHHY